MVKRGRKKDGRREDNYNTIKEYKKKEEVIKARLTDKERKIKEITEI